MVINKNRKCNICIIIMIKEGAGMSILTREQVQELLQISENQARALFKVPGFPGFRIGAGDRVEESRLLDFFDKNKHIKLDY